jgi:hypothetical protein
VGQPSVFGGNWLVRALFVGLRAGSYDKLAASGQAGAAGTSGAVTHMAACPGAWPPGDALVEFVGRCGLDQRVGLVLLTNVAAPRCRDTSIP